MEISTMPAAKIESPEQRERRLANQRRRQQRYDAKRREAAKANRVRDASGGGDGRLLGIGLVTAAVAPPGTPPGFEWFGRGESTLPGVGYERWLDERDRARAADGPRIATVQTPTTTATVDCDDLEDVARMADACADECGLDPMSLRECISRLDGTAVLDLRPIEP